MRKTKKKRLRAVAVYPVLQGVAIVSQLDSEKKTLLRSIEGQRKYPVGVVVKAGQGEAINVTTDDFKKLRDRIDERYKADMAALERTWALMRGENPPESVVVLMEPKDGSETIGLPAVQFAERPKNPKRVAAMKAAWAKRRKQNKA